MRIDLHNHTFLCHHATGTLDEYIQKAIEEGVGIFGFSDHAPMDFDHRYRMDLKEMAFYESLVQDAKMRYKDSIEILLGYEVDFLPGYMEKMVLEADVDYLIGSVHFIDGWGFDNPEFIGKYAEHDIDKVWQDYFDLIESMARSSHFDIVGHLDLVKVFKFLPKKDVRLIAQNALKAIKKANMVLEISSAGLRKPIQEAYPSRTLLEMAMELDIPITFGSDAHAPEQVGFKRNEIEELAREIGYSHCAVFRKRERELIIF